MKKQTKIIAIAIGLVIVAGLGTYAVNPDLFQGRFSRSKISRTVKTVKPVRTVNTPTISDCPYEFGNFDPNSGSTAEYGDKIDFRWNGPGCSRYEWKQYLLCFENVYNSQEYRCIGVLPNSNHMTLSKNDWRLINNAMKTKTSYKVSTKWYVISRFGDAFNGEDLKTDTWKFTYGK